MEIKEINFFTVGDANDTNVLSGVPFFFSNALEKKGITVNRINIGPERVYDILYRTLMKLWKILTGKYYWAFYHTPFYQFLASFIISKSCRKYKNADINLFMTFSFSSKFCSDLPVILFGDMTFERLLARQKREPDSVAQYAIFKQNECINTADIVVSFFSKLKQEMDLNFINKKIMFLGHALNFNSLDFDHNRILEIKKTSHEIVFIGRQGYIEGANRLIKAFEILSLNQPDVYTLNIIGLNRSDFEFNIPSNVKFYGYLRKNVKIEYEKYIELIIRSAIFVNPTPQGGAFQTIIEVLYLYTPIVIPSEAELYAAFKSDLGKISILLEDLRPENIADEICKIFLKRNELLEMSLAAHHSVHKCSWDDFVDKFIASI